MAGLVGSVIGLFPLRFLPGWAIREWRRDVWAAVLGVTSFGVIQVLLALARGDRTTPAGGW